MEKENFQILAGAGFAVVGWLLRRFFRRIDRLEQGLTQVDARSKARDERIENRVATRNERRDNKTDLLLGELTRTLAGMVGRYETFEKQIAAQLSDLARRIDHQ